MLTHSAPSSPLPDLSALSTSTLYSFLAPITIPSRSPSSRFSNWARTYSCRPLSVFEPTTIDQCRVLIELARREGVTIRVAGVGHSPSDLACTRGFMIRSGKMNRLLEVWNPMTGSVTLNGANTSTDANLDVERGATQEKPGTAESVVAKMNEGQDELPYVVVEGGMSISDLHTHLTSHGLGMSNLGSISEVSIAGAISTATHGTGLNFGVISTQVLALNILVPSADFSQSDESDLAPLHSSSSSQSTISSTSSTLVHCSRTRNPSLFFATLCGIGCTGIIASVKLRVEPFFRLKQESESVSFDWAVNNLETIAESSEHTRLWWFHQARSMRCERMNRTNEPPSRATSWFWDVLVMYYLCQFTLFIGKWIPRLNTWLALVVAWIGSSPGTIVDDSYKIFNIDCPFLHYTIEWAIPLPNARACLQDLAEWFEKENYGKDGLRPHFPIEIRFTKEDDIWLSPSYGQKTCWIGIVQYKPYGFIVPYRALFAEFERILISHKGRPHWAKAHHQSNQQLSASYPHFKDFVELIKRVDPAGLFRNEYVRRHLFGEEGENVSFEVYSTD